MKRGGKQGALGEPRGWTQDVGYTTKRGSHERLILRVIWWTGKQGISQDPARGEELRIW